MEKVAPAYGKQRLRQKRQFAADHFLNESLSKRPIKTLSLILQVVNPCWPLVTLLTGALTRNAAPN